MLAAVAVDFWRLAVPLRACVTIKWRDGSGWGRDCCQDGG
jgi:hypothetical protein